LNEAKRFLTILEYAEHVGRSYRTVYGWVERRVIPSIKVGSILIDPIKADLALERFERQAIENPFEAKPEAARK
jgi:excisionase family DNA binding protein